MTKARDGLDQKDRMLLAELRSNCRTPIAELARRIELERTPTVQRIKRLEKLGYIGGYSIVAGAPKDSAPIVTKVILISPLNPAEGQSVSAIMTSIDSFIRGKPHISWAARIEGEFGYIIEFEVFSHEENVEFFRELREIEEIGRTLTMSIIEDVKPRC
jgi:Lrp/AsnC family transcriptional regulator, leucine-responsive regulatory protein